MFAIQWNVKHAAAVKLDEITAQSNAFAQAVMDQAKRMQRKRCAAPAEESAGAGSMQADSN